MARLTGRAASVANRKVSKAKAAARKTNESATTNSQPSSQLKALSVALATGAPVSKGVRDNSGNDVGGRVLSRPSSTLAAGVKPYSGPVEYTGQEFENPGTPPAAPNIPDKPRISGTPMGGNTGFNSRGKGLGLDSAAPIQSGVSNNRSDQFFKSLIDSLRPSNEENNVANQQAALESELRNTNQGQDEMNRNIKDQPIALPFITGQQSAVEERYALRRGDIGNRQQTLQAKLANLQARRQAAMDVSKTGLQYSQQQDDREYQRGQDTKRNNMQLSGQYADILQQQYQNRQGESRYKDAQTQQTFENSLATDKYNLSASKKTGSSSRGGSGGGGSTTPQGGYDSSGGVNFVSAPKKTVLTKVQSMFAPSTAAKIQVSLTDEQLRLFMNDYTTTQNQSQQSIIPESYLEQWKTAAGIGAKSSGGRSV